MSGKDAVYKLVYDFMVSGRVCQIADTMGGTGEGMAADHDGICVGDSFAHLAGDIGIRLSMDDENGNFCVFDSLRGSNFL